ncbi:MAG: carboxypeptidase regulatory-like domain-containing protein [Pseudomonadota bacterium]
MKPIKVLETNILHASDVLYWLDGSSGETLEKMTRIPETLTLQLTTRPRDLQLVNGRGKTALLRRPTNEIIDGIASDADKQMPVTPTYPVAGVVSDPSGRFIPRRFSINAGNGAGHALAVYPSPLGTRLGPTGGLVGTLRYAASNTPVPWAMLTLIVDTTLSSSYTFRCQATAQGDFIMPLRGLPPLPEGIDHYSAELGIQALLTASGDVPVDPADLVAMSLGQLETPDAFSDPISFDLVPNEIRIIRSSNRDHLAVQPL